MTSPKTAAFIEPALVSTNRLVIAFAPHPKVCTRRACADKTLPIRALHSQTPCPLIHFGEYGGTDPHSPLRVSRNKFWVDCGGRDRHSGILESARQCVGFYADIMSWLTGL